MPVYNVEKYLRKCLDSILNQTFQDFEIICVDDGSSDKSLEILEEYAKKDSRFVILKEIHLGAGEARNRGLELAKGKYIQFLDSDDYFEPDMLEELYNRAEKYQADLTVCSARKVDKDGNITESGNPIWPLNLDKVLLDRPFSPEEFSEDIFSLFCVIPWNKLYLRELITKNNLKFQNLTSSNDLGFGYIVKVCAKKIVVFNSELINYRYNREGSIRAERGSGTINILYAGRYIKDFLVKNNLFDKYGKSFESAFIRDIRAGISLCNNDEYKIFMTEFQEMFTEEWTKFASGLKNDFITIKYLNDFVGNKKVVLWGASLFLRKLLENESEKNPNILGIIDKNNALWGQKCGNYRIYPPDALKELKPEGVISTIYNNHESAHYTLNLYLKDNCPDIHLLDDIFTDNSLPRNYCPYCDYRSVFKAMGKSQRKHVRCPICNSLERHRFLYFVYQIIIPKSDKKLKVLHTAPERSIYNYFRQRNDIEYECIDLNPQQYTYTKNCKEMNILDMQYGDNVFDYIISNHVLEHIEDEAGFFTELLRVLKPNGKIILSAPYFTDLDKTFEDKSIVTEQERQKFYGQGDHVRKYGRDIFSRLSVYGKVTQIDRDCIPKYLADEMVLKYPHNVSDAVIIMEK